MRTTLSRVALSGLLAFIVYPLSFAPMLRAIEGPDFVYPEENVHLCIDPPTDLPVWTIPYRPVIALIEHTSLGEPLQTWAELWDVRLQQFGTTSGGFADDDSLLEMLGGTLRPGSQWTTESIVGWSI